MHELLVWVYLANSVLLINHEIDSAYWREWELFKLPGSINEDQNPDNRRETASLHTAQDKEEQGFLIVHFPLLFLFLYGFIQVVHGSFAGLIFSLLLSLVGIFAFTIHMIFIKKGHKQFRTPVSIAILAMTLLTSLAQALVTISLLLAR